MDEEPVPALWAVAGCLFEVALPVLPGGRWRWAGGTQAVTLLTDDVRAGVHHFRFRAEGAGAEAGGAELRFMAEGEGGERRVAVRIAPERLPGPP